jgi:dihydropyrimidine dehydrogenase (NAD+) subunit PreT
MKTLSIDSPIMSEAQLQMELSRCEYCEEKPCKVACPVNCSPFDFIMAARVGNSSDIRRAAAEIMHANPLGGVCGMVCPDRLCMAACTRKDFDGAINIPRVQATLIEMAKHLGGISGFSIAKLNGEKVAVIGGGPSGLGASAVLAQLGYSVDIFENKSQLGGMMNLIPNNRLEKRIVETDIKFLLSLGKITVKTNAKVENPGSLLNHGYDAVCVATGLWKPIELGIQNESLAITMVDLLSNPDHYNFNGRVAVIGGGATAVDCAITAKERGAMHVELYMLEKLSEMPLTKHERQELVDFDIEVNGRIRVSRIISEGNAITGIETRKVQITEGLPFKPANVRDTDKQVMIRNDINQVVMAIGMRSSLVPEQTAGIFYCGDIVNGPTTVVEAVASGKNAATEVDTWLKHKELPHIEKRTKSTFVLPGYQPIPVSLATDFFGRPIKSPYLLSASPMTDGFEQMEKAYQSGWPGGIMKTAFDNVPIHIPAEYMFIFNPYTYANADNVSGHSLERVCHEVEQLINKWPDRLTIASTGGPVTGHDQFDKAGWQSNTKKLERAGAMAIEYSLSCPQGGDGTEGDIVSQNAALTAKIIEWVMEIGNQDIPKLFKLTAAVTSIIPILRAIRLVLGKFPEKKAGVTLANSFPSLAFRPAKDGHKWDEGVIVGMSGEGVTPISNLTLTQAVPEGIEISGNGGPMNYKAAMDFLALGVKTVQFCTIATKHGYGIINDLESGTSFLMQERGIRSMSELIGIAQPHSITDFMALSPIKTLSAPDWNLCVSCGNCARCPYLAIELDDKHLPYTDPARCIGCSLCAKKCFTGAISMRDRTTEELTVLKEN